LLDISPDDAVDLNNKRRIMRWDAKKNKFVKQTLAEMAEVRGKGVKRIRSENGFISKKSATPQGEMYEKWKKRTRREIGGAADDEPKNAQRGMPNMKVNSKVKDELRSVADIRKFKDTKDNNKLKNTKKDKRKQIEAAGRQKKKARQEKFGVAKVNAVTSRRSKLVVRM